MSKEIRIHIQVVDAEDGEVLFRSDTYAIDSAIESLGSFERNHMVDGKVV